MGGKAKQRVKHNAKPSSSSRSAEQMQQRKFQGSAGIDPFASTDMSKLPLMPGFSLEQLPESFDSNISAEFQLVLRKMSKKDPLTKKKALNEFIDLVNNSELDTLKTVLPLFPRHYHNLATDPEHMVRELSQTALRTLVAKCKRAVAPYLKQLLPIWLLSQFDNYAPAASVAVASFNETFVGTADRTQEVLLHCHAEILEHATRNLTFHTASTLSSGKDLAPEEAEQKYQRAVVSSLKALSFLVEKTDGCEDSDKISNDLKCLIENQKFWSLSKTKTSAIRASWFEFVYHVLQSAYCKNVIVIEKTSLITLSFQNIDDSDAAVGTYAWACVLTIQTSYNEWYTLINLRKAVLPKLSALLRNGFNGNATTLCSNILPFFSKMTPEALQDIEYFQFCRTFFSDFQESIFIESSRSKAEMNAIIKAYFECLRYLCQKLNIEKHSTTDAESLALWLLDDHLIASIKWFLEGNGNAVKCYFQQVASLIAFWTDRCNGDNVDDQNIYKKLTERFWQRSYETIHEIVDHKDVSNVCMERVIQFLQDLCTANPNFEGRNIKFCDNNESTQESSVKCQTKSDCKETTKCNRVYKLIEPKLKKIVTHIVRLLIKNIDKNNAAKGIKYIHSLTQLYTDIEFHKSLGDDGGTILGTVQIFQNLFDCLQQNKEASELVIDIIFTILQNIDISETLSYIKNFMKADSQRNIKILILQRLLSHPYCNEVEVRSIIAQQDISALIIDIAREALDDSAKEKFNILHKCFFQFENGDVIIDRATVDKILEVLCEALFSAETKESIHACSSFLAQTMPVFCLSENASKHVKVKVFLHLFEFTMKNLKADDYIPDETLWEIATSWQDALSSGDIVIESEILQCCGQLIEKYADTANLECELVDKMANVLSKFICCATERITEKCDQLKWVNTIIKVVFQSNVMNEKALSSLKDLCTLLEASNFIASAGTSDLSNNCLQQINKIQHIFRRVLLNVSIIKKLICKSAENPTQGEDEYSSIDEDGDANNKHLLTQWPPELLTVVVDYFVIGAVGESFLTNNLYPIDETTEWYLVSLSETLKTLISDESELITTVIENLLDNALKNQNVSICRALKFLIYAPEYAQFEENATIVLAERFSELFVGQTAFEAYVCSLQYLMPNLTAKALTMRSTIMQSDIPHDIWIKFVMFRCLIENNFSKVESNETADKAIPLAALQFITNFIESSQKFNKENFLYNTTIETKQFVNVNSTVEYINLLCTLVRNFPYQMTLKNWDALRIGLSSWALSVSKSHSGFMDPKVFLTITRVFRLYETFKNFILIEKQKSSTSVITSVIEEWENLFAREVELVLFNFFFKLCDDEFVGNASTGIDYDCFGILMKHIVRSIELIDYNFVYSSYKCTDKMDVLLSFLLKNLSNRLHCIRTCSAHILRELTKHCVAADILTMEKTNEALDDGRSRFPGLHFLNNFDDYLTRYGMPIRKYLEEFSFKLAEISEFGPIDRDEALSYLLLWDCIIYVCANAPLSLRSIYTRWVHDNRYEEDYIHFLFRCMPAEVLKNHDSKIMSNDLFKGLTDAQIKESNISIEKLACHLYAETLRKFPAIVRKWWNTCPSRQKTFIDKLTTNFVSSLICNDELKTIANRKEKHENMQVTVHFSTREVLAVYSIDEARMELVITLAHNYPLGSVKLDCGKQIGGRVSSRNIGMQLSIFLTHQNGSICDGLTLWKSNLDKKFAGVEECYICYTVIHHETFRLPKLSCKTCKKKFHGPCLYKWFTTSSKSTCPICRNVF